MSDPSDALSQKRQIQDQAGPNNTKKFKPNGQNVTEDPDIQSSMNIIQTQNNLNQPSNLATIQLQSGTGLSSVPNVSETKTQQEQEKQDTSKLNDAIAAAGVDIQREEELLLQQQQSRRFEGLQDRPSFTTTSKTTPFLNPYHLAAFIDKIAKTRQINQNFLEDGDMLNLISAACENWIAHIASKTLILSRHRRRGIVTSSTKKNTSSSSSSSSFQRSGVSRELRNMALRQKEMEEKRVQKRLALGLEKSSHDSTNEENNDGKAGAEDSMHRAANATASMMTMGKKKYSWMNAGGGNSSGADFDKGSNGVKNRQSPIIAIRGDNGLRYREVRSGNSIVLKDLLGAIEDQKKGTQHAIVKGYAKLRD
ncbi:TAF4 [Candida pseudojiufengensis]|uniref:TAF4 n=1 Tax=Candida pseudojiufengensis TaxID=497109 RepID=UPI00222489C1|nr:TAF4 [Candida pseudojiufengensis]KAI5965221.1 TAF4 [Candida pseudojiufengensis]